MRLFLIALFSLTSVSCFAQEPCGFSEAMCAAQSNFEKADSELTETYQKILRKIEQGDYEDYLVSKEAIQQSLEKAQTAWLNYRDENCEAHYTLMSGGTSKNIDRLECQTEMTGLRSQDLRNLYE